MSIFKDTENFLKWLKTTNKREYMLISTGFKMWQEGKLTEGQVYKFEDMLRVKIVEWEVSQYAKIK